jgi:hypothetical protein
MIMMPMKMMVIVMMIISDDNNNINDRDADDMPKLTTAL